MRVLVLVVGLWNVVGSCKSSCVLVMWCGCVGGEGDMSLCLSSLCVSVCGECYREV